MKIFAALDVSDKSTHVCVVDGDGVGVWRGVWQLRCTRNNH